MTQEDPDGSKPISLPIFDLSHPTQDLSNRLVSALREYGFLFLRSNGGLPLSPDSISRTFSLSSQFFHLPRSVKESVPMQGDNRGWTAMHAEELDPSDSKSGIKGDPKEAFNFGEFLHGHADQPLPPLFADSGNEKHFATFQDGCRELCLALLSLIETGLSVSEPEFFKKRHDPKAAPSGSILRLLYYPPTPPSSSSSISSSEAKAKLRAGAHSDYGSLTLLFRRDGDGGDAGGLEILSEGNWSTVPVRPRGTEEDAAPPVLVNVGDLLSYWTGGLLRSTVHRVAGCRAEGEAVGEAESRGGGGAEAGARDGGEVGSGSSRGEERYSIAYFCHPCRDTLLEPVPSEVVRRHVASEREKTKANGNEGDGKLSGSATTVITATEHLQARLRATYGWNEEEVRTA